MKMPNPAAVANGGSAGLAVIVAAVGAVVFVIAPLSDNLRYEAGVSIVGEASAAGMFSHRPLAYRVLLAAIFDLAHVVSIGRLGVAGFEVGVRLILIGLVVGAALLLWRGLLRQSAADAGSQALVVGGALVLLGPISAGEPEWMATTLVVAATGAALLGSRRPGIRGPWLLAAVAGALLLIAAGMKIITVVPVTLGLLLVALVDRRQAFRVGVCFVGAGLVFVATTLVWVPWELQWLRDIGSVQNPPTAGFGEAPGYFLALVADNPVLLLFPAAIVMARPRERWVIGAAVAATTLTVFVQGQYFGYHAIPLVAVSAVAFCRVLTQRLSRLEVHRLHAGLVSVAVTLALLAPGALPWAVGLPAGGPERRDRAVQAAIAVHTVIGGPTVPVTYLTPGAWPYFIANPTSCRYPSPLFLQRTLKPKRLTTASYAENVRCLSAPDSRWLIIDPSWFRVAPQPRRVKRILAREWACDAATEVAGLRLCPRRS